MPWQNPQTGAGGNITPLATSYSEGGLSCRDFLASYVHGGSQDWLQGAACRTSRRQVGSQKPEALEAVLTGYHRARARRFGVALRDGRIHPTLSAVGGRGRPENFKRSPWGMRDPYEILGVDRKASAADIKSAYRRLAKKLHPDANKNDPKAATRFAELNAAHELLGDEDKRKAFDRGEIDAEGKPKFQGFEGFGAGASARPGGGFNPDFNFSVCDVGGLVASLAGLMLSGRIASVVSSQGQNLIFYDSSASVIGGISLYGGRGRLIGALTGVLLLGILQNVLRSRRFRRSGSTRPTVRSFCSR